MTSSDLENIEFIKKKLNRCLWFRILFLGSYEFTAFEKEDGNVELLANGSMFKIFDCPLMSFRFVLGTCVITHSNRSVIVGSRTYNNSAYVLYYEH